MNWNPARPRPRLRGSLLAFALVRCAHARPTTADAQAIASTIASTTPVRVSAAGLRRPRSEPVRVSAAGLRRPRSAAAEA